MIAMASAPVLSAERARRMLGRGWHPVALWVTFVAVHGALIALCLLAPGWPLGDIERVYLGWAEAAASGAGIVGITSEFVYPILALLPILAALALGPDWYPIVWLGLVTLMNAGAFWFLLTGGATPRARARRAAAAWWWLGFLLLLGPIALARIDSVTVPVVIVGLLVLRTRPVWGTVLLTLATWIKVWPAAAIAAILIASRHRWRLLGVAAMTSATIVLVTFVLGGGAQVFSFVSQQTGRGIQIESPVAVPWLWRIALGDPEGFIYYDRQILTYQVAGTGIDAAISWMTPLLALAVAAVLLLGWRALRNGMAFVDLFPVLVLGLVTTMIVFNKVGSPQFISWLAAPVILAIVIAGERAWRTPAVLITALAALTHLVYPYLYDFLLAAHPAMLAVLTIRNALELVVLGWAVKRLWALPQPVNR